MKFKTIKISNFRKLSDINFECSQNITTIVGPNGVGKSSILDAVRIVKAILLPSSRDESQQSLQNLGLFSPHLNQLLIENISGDIKKETFIDIAIEVSQQEIDGLKQDLENFNMLRLQNQLGQSSMASINFIGFLSTPVGKQRFIEIQKETDKLFAEFQESNTAQIKLLIKNNQVRGHNGFHQELISHLFKSPVFSETLFTVFTADRNFPTGDANIQLGQSEIAQQLQSYSIQPQAKFARLKAAIISFIMINSNDISQIQNDFKLIFDSLIPGKSLFGINLEEKTGRLSVLIKEINSEAIYDIDFLSSGEKGLLLTLFLLLRTVREHGIILLDEPELHLNPAVCKNIIPFLKKYICENKKAQIILTTHSADILAETKNHEDCQLLHLINENTITPIYKKDNEEAQGAIKSLGITTSDLFFNKGVIYLEGTTDDDYMYEVLKGQVTGFKIQNLGGRTVIENEIKILQEADKKGELQGFHVFILDLDNKPTMLESTTNVKTIQWDRYSFENYLLNVIILYEVVKELEPKDFPIIRSEFNKQVKELALSQIEGITIYDTIDNLVPQILSVPKKEIKGKDVGEVANIVCDKIENLQQSLNCYSKSTFSLDFQNDFKKRTSEMRLDWDDDWKLKCKGKELLLSVYNKYALKNHKNFIKSLIRNNKIQNSEEWKLIVAKLSPIIHKK